jgi:hypothetical protein
VLVVRGFRAAVDVRLRVQVGAARLGFWVSIAVPFSRIRSSSPRFASAACLASPRPRFAATCLDLPQPCLASASIRGDLPRLASALPRLGLDSRRLASTCLSLASPRPPLVAWRRLSFASFASFAWATRIASPWLADSSLGSRDRKPTGTGDRARRTTCLSATPISGPETRALHVTGALGHRAVRAIVTRAADERRSRGGPR